MTWKSDDRRREYSRERYAKRKLNPETKEKDALSNRARAEAYRLKKWDDPAFREKARESTRRWRARHKERVAEINRSRLLSAYQLTNEDYSRSLLAQGGTCAICKRPDKKRRLAVDHDHETGKLRGLLCNKCNRALGLLEDSTQSLASAIEYLNKYKGV